MSAGASRYRGSAEFYEMVAARQAPSSGPPLRVALTGTDTSTGPVLEIGAGTGAITRVIADILPDARILATEPSEVMRGILTSRVHRDPDLRRRVTVTPDPAEALPAGPSCCAAVLFGVVGHLTAPERAALWTTLRSRMAPGGRIAVELMGVAAPRTIPPVRMLREAIGEQTYEWWSSGTPVGADLMRFESRWKVFRGRELLREVTESHDWHTLTSADLARESGLRATRITDVDGAPTAEICVLHT